MAVSLAPSPGDLLHYGPQLQGERDATALRESHAHETVLEHYNTRAIGTDGDGLAQRVALAAPGFSWQRRPRTGRTYCPSVVT